MWRWRGARIRKCGAVIGEATTDIAAAEAGVMRERAQWVPMIRAANVTTDQGLAAKRGQPAPDSEGGDVYIGRPPP